MMGTMPEMDGLDYSNYPDVTAAGDLRCALQGTLDSIGTPLYAQHVEAPGWVLTHAVVSVDDRKAYIHMVSGDRSFGLDFLDAWLPDGRRSCRKPPGCRSGHLNVPGRCQTPAPRCGLAIR